MTVRITAAGGMTEVGAKNGLIVQHGTGAIVVDWGQKIPLHAADETEGGRLSGQHDLGDEYYPDAELLTGLSVKALCVTHGHQDHSEGAHRIWGRYPGVPVITDPFTELVMEMRSGKARRAGFPFESFVTHATRLKMGDFVIERFPVNHSIWGACGFLIEVGGRRIVHLGDFKSWPVRAGADKNREIFGAIASLGSIDAVIMDATNSEEPGFVISEDTVAMSIANILEKERGNVFFAAISSNTRRFSSIVSYAAKQGRPVYVAGGSVRDFFRLANFSGWQDIRAQDYGLEPDPSSWPHDAVICVTGSQGEYGSFLHKIAEGQFSSLANECETLVITQDTIPLPDIQEQFAHVVGALSGMFTKIYLTEDTPDVESLGADIIRMPHLHASGHGKQGDMKRVFEILEPRLVIPCHADLSKRVKLADLVRQWGGEAELVNDGETLTL